MNKYILSTFLFFALHCMNLFSNKVHACTGRDVIFTSITFTSITSGNYQYSYQIKNIGTTGIAFNQLVIQNYVSTDNQVGSDAAAGGSFIDHLSSAVLAAGATYNGTYYASPFPANPQNSYPYLIANIYLNTDSECDVTNNNFITFIQIPAGIQSFIITDASVNWVAESKSFTVNNWPSNNSELIYSVYNLAGILIDNGNTREQESTPLKELSKGLYILYLSDEQKIFSKKIVY